MRWLMRFFDRSTREACMVASVPYRSDPTADEAKRDYQSDKLAALDAEIERLAQLRRLGYDFDVATRQDSDAAH